MLQGRTARRAHTREANQSGLNTTTTTATDDNTAWGATATTAADNNTSTSEPVSPYRQPTTDEA